MTNSNDEYSTIVNEEYEGMIEFPFLYIKGLDLMTDKEKIDFYKYVVRTINMPRDIRCDATEVRRDLEELPLIQAYIDSIQANSELSPDDERLIAETVQLLEKRRKDKKNPIKRFIKTIKR